MQARRDAEAFAIELAKVSRCECVELGAGAGTAHTDAACAVEKQQTNVRTDSQDVGDTEGGEGLYAEGGISEHLKESRTGEVVGVRVGADAGIGLKKLKGRCVESKKGADMTDLVIRAVGIARGGAVAEEAASAEVVHQEGHPKGSGSTRASIGCTQQTG